MRILETSTDVDEQVLEIVEEVFDGWYADEARIDWEDFIDRIARYGNSENPPFDIESYDNAAIRKIRRHVAKLRADLN